MITRCCSELSHHTRPYNRHSSLGPMTAVVSGTCSETVCMQSLLLHSVLRASFKECGKMLRHLFPQISSIEVTRKCEERLQQEADLGGSIIVKLLLPDRTLSTHQSPERHAEPGPLRQQDENLRIRDISLVRSFPGSSAVSLVIPSSSACCGVTSPYGFSPARWPSRAA